MSENRSINIVGFYARTNNFQTVCLAQEAPGEFEYKVSVRVSGRELNEKNQFVVALELTLNGRAGGVEVAQGEFKVEVLAEVEGYAEREQHEILNTFLPNQAVPYLRELVSNATSRTGFPAFVLPPFVMKQGNTPLPSSNPRVESPLKQLT